jgi:hypothetical protein
MSAISSVSATPVHQAAPPPAPAKVDSDGDHDNSPPSEASSQGSTRALNVLA